MVVANTIAAQIGRRAFFMMGAREKIGASDGLRFRVGRNAKGVTHVFVTLAADDTYTVEFRSIRVSRKAAVGFTDKLKAKFEGVYVDNLHEILEVGTGLAVSL